MTPMNTNGGPQGDSLYSVLSVPRDLKDGKIGVCPQRPPQRLLGWKQRVFNSGERARNLHMLSFDEHPSDGG